MITSAIVLALMFALFLAIVLGGGGAAGGDDGFDDLRDLGGDSPRFLGIEEKQCKSECRKFLTTCKEECVAKKKSRFLLENEDYGGQGGGMVKERILKGSKGSSKSSKSRTDKNNDKKEKRRANTKACKARCKQEKFRCTWKCYPVECKANCKPIVKPCLGKCDRTFAGEEVPLCHVKCYKKRKDRVNGCLRECLRQSPRRTPVPFPVPVPLPPSRPSSSTAPEPEPASATPSPVARRQ